MANRQTARHSRPAAQAEGDKPLDGHATPVAGEGTGELDRLVHERIRLGMLGALAVNKSLSFTDLKGLLQTSDGNLSVHARKLEDAGYVSCSKSFSGRFPKTEYQLTPKGRRSLTRYLDHMEAVIQAMRRG